MKHLTFLIALLMCCGIAKAQQISMTVDNQTPGWLSSKINYSDQATLRNIKVTGYINGTDIKFIRELNTNRQLHGVIDLSEANILAGGEAYYAYTSGGSTKSYTTQDNALTEGMFVELDSIQKLVLPNSLDTCITNNHFGNICIDSLIVNGKMKKFASFSNNITNGYGWGHPSFHYVKFSDTIEELNYGYLTSSKYGNVNVTVVLPKSLKEIKAETRLTKLHASMVWYSPIEHPENVKGSICYETGCGTLYVPKGTKALYEKSIFKYFTIIENIAPESIAIDMDKVRLHTGETHTLSATVLPSDAINTSVKWSSLNEDIAEVDSTGKVTAKGLGTAKIVATTYDGLLADTCLVYVFEHTSGVSCDQTVSLYIGEQKNVNANTLPLNTSDGELTYYSNNESVAVVDANGNVKGVSKGSCVITVTSVDGGYTATCTVKVMQPVTEVKLEKHETTLNVGGTEELRAQVSPSDADNKQLVWSSENESIATVNAEGKVKGMKAGTVRIYVQSADNEELSDYCTVTVLQPVTGITLDQSSITLTSIGTTYQLNATVQPADASNKELRWTSGNASVAYVSNNGSVVAMGDGSTVVMATTVDGGHLATCTVTVATSSAGIDNLNADADPNATYYNMSGQRVGQPNGLTIVRQADGTTRKMIKK